MMMMFGLILMFFFTWMKMFASSSADVILFFVFPNLDSSSGTCQCCERKEEANEDVELQGLPATASWLLQRLPYQPQAAFASGG